MESIQAMKLSKINHNLQDITKSNKSTKRKSSKFVEVCSKFMFKFIFLISVFLAFLFYLESIRQSICK
jgi:hypothetical protein